MKSYHEYLLQLSEKYHIYTLIYREYNIDYKQNIQLRV